MMAVSERTLLLHGFYLNYLNSFVSLGVIVLLTPVLLRELGRADYGFWAIFTSLIAYCSLLDIGTNTAVMKYVSEYRARNDDERLNQLVSTILLLMLVVVALIVLFSLLFASSIMSLFAAEGQGTSRSTALLITAFGIASMLLCGVFGSVLFGLQRVDVVKGIAVVQAIVNGGLAFLFVRRGSGLPGVALAFLLSTLMQAVLLVFFLARGDHRIMIRFRFASLSTLWEIGPYSLRTFVLGISSRLLYYSDYVVIGALLGAAAIAPYEVAYKLCFLSTYVFSIISGTMFPKCAELHAIGEMARLRIIYLRITKISLMIVAAAGVFLMLYGESLVQVWVGEGNFAGMGVITVLVVMNVFHAIGTPAAMILQSSGRNQRLMYAEILNAALNLLLSIMLVKWMGLVGAALGTLVAHLSSSFWIVLRMPCHTMALPVKTYVRTSVVPPLAAGLATGLVMLAVSRWPTPSRTLGDILLGGGAVVAIYAATYITLGASGEERQAVRRWLKTIPTLRLLDGSERH